MSGKIPLLVRRGARANQRFVGKRGRGDRSQVHFFAKRLEAEGFSILNEVVLNQVLVSFGDAETTQRVIRAIQEDGTCWCGGTVWHGQTAMRISIASWATDETDIERSLSAIIPIAK